MKKIILLLLCAFTFLFSNANNEKKKLIVLDPASIEILYMLNAQDSIKGIANLQYSPIYPFEETKKLPSVGSFSHPSIEKIVALKPDLVILSQYSMNLKSKLDELKIDSILLKGDSFEDIRHNISYLGKLLHKDKNAKDVIKKFNEDLENLAKDPLNKTALFLYSSQPLMAFGGATIINDVLKTIGITNLAPQDIDRPMIDGEYLLSKNPDILIYGMQIESIDLLTKNNALLKKTKAFKNNKIYQFDNVYSLLRASPRIVEKIKELKALIK